eukprot:TRINITY_DN10364_c0_g2_i5.p2 TRINITY_DN10364_c0_g2~~TRINITY_DN10364_c0_g2_i5.p2  ORF type:complete len:248 (-),score=-12.21 TRINITY_DN10364_c0_g2_i5:147-890(-)
METKAKKSHYQKQPQDEPTNKPALLNQKNQSITTFYKQNMMYIMGCFCTGNLFYCKKQQCCSRYHNVVPFFILLTKNSCNFILVYKLSVETKKVVKILVFFGLLINSVYVDTKQVFYEKNLNCRISVETCKRGKLPKTKEQFLLQFLLSTHTIQINYTSLLYKNQYVQSFQLLNIIKYLAFYLAQTRRQQQKFIIFPNIKQKKDSLYFQYGIIALSYQKVVILKLKLQKRNIQKVQKMQDAGLANLL